MTTMKGAHWMLNNFAIFPPNALKISQCFYQFKNFIFFKYQINLTSGVGVASHALFSVNCLSNTL